MSNESLIEKLKLEKSGKMTRTWELFDKGIDRAIEIIRQHESQQPSEDVVERVARAIYGQGALPDDSLITKDRAREMAKAAIKAMNMGDAGKDLTPNSSTKYARSTDQGAHDAGGLNPPPSTHTLNRVRAYLEAKKHVTGLHPEVIHVIHANGGKHELRVSDLEALLPSEITDKKLESLYQETLQQLSVTQAELLKLRIKTKRGYIDNKSPEEIERICKIIKGFWDLHSTEPATGFTPEELAKEIVNGKHSPPT